MDQYWYVQSLVDANLCRPLNIALNRSILACSKSCQCKSFDIALNEPILSYSKSRRCKFIDFTLN
uniref:Uncharacterized protein n=1 Tax=viral metagenome TaxID=1070528 RepID=A0A6C0C8Z6_9ZZZZ